MNARFPIMTAATIVLLAALRSEPASAKAPQPDLLVEITTTVNSDGSGTVDYRVDLSQSMMNLLKSAPGFASDGMCDSYFQFLTGSWEKDQTQMGGAVTCTAAASFADLQALIALAEANFPGAHFVRLEITGGHFYYDLAPNVSGSEFTGTVGENLPFEIQASWILNVPGDVVSSNADTVLGTKLTWDLLKLNSSSHITAESTVGGSGGWATDPTMIVLGIVALLGCCFLFLILAGVAAFFILRRKNPPPRGIDLRRRGQTDFFL